MDHPLSRRIGEVLVCAPEAGAVEYDRQWISWRRLGEHARAVGAAVAAHTTQRPAPVGLMLRNHPAHVGALLGVLLSGATAVAINPARGDARTRADVEALGLPVVVGDDADLSVLAGAVPHTTRIHLCDTAPEPAITAARSPGPACATRPGVAVRMLTSGTTGPPKRVDLTYDMLAHSVMGADYATAGALTQLRRGVAIVNSPLVHIGGVYRVLSCVTAGRPFVLLERFELDRWVDAVRRHRPRAASLVPAALRAVLHSDVRREDLASLQAVTSGTAPLSADDAEAFTERFGIPVLTSYAATEFGGGVAGWTLADHRRFWAAKRGSVGRADPGAQLRVVDDDGVARAPGDAGTLEVKPAQHGRHAPWVRTTDLARLDADGFLWILGRADQAIIRGGFKVLPDDVRAALETHPAVAGAAVVGRPHPRLGESPVAAVELRDGQHTDAAALTAYLSERLARYEIPTDIAVVPVLPRTPSGKADLTAVRRLLDPAADAD